MIYINSYRDINNLPFGSTESEALVAFGPAIKQKVNRENEKELYYSDVILRFEAATGLLRECTLLPDCKATINNKMVLWDDEFLHWLAGQDQDLVEVLGYIISIKLGIAITGFHDGDESQKAIHLFKFGDWDMFRNRMNPFTLKDQTSSTTKI